MIRRKQLRRKITDIKIQRRNSSRRTLIFDDNSVFGISEDVFIISNLSVGDYLGEKDYQRLLEKESKNKIKEAALLLLQYRMRSIFELSDRLQKKGYGKEEIEPVIEELKAKGYLNDEEFAFAFCRDKVRSKRIGPSALRQELIVHRLDQTLVNNVFESIYKEYPIKDLIEFHLTKRKIHTETQLDAKEKQKLLSFLKRKGFSWNDVSHTLNELEIS